MEKRSVLLRRMAAIGLAAALLLGLMGCSPKSDSVSRSEFMLDTIITITLYDTEDEQPLSDCFTTISECEQLFSRTIATSDIARLNDAQGEWVTIDERTADLLQKSIQMAQLCEGAFDPTIGAVSSLWDFNAEQPAVPDAAVVAQAATHVDYTKLEVSGNRARLLDPEAMVDLGGIAKGYIADLLCEQLRGQGIQSAILNLGGNIYALGSKEGEDWYIGVRLPTGTEDEAAAAVCVQNTSVVTSGIYERYFVQDGVTYYHLLNPHTGYPAQSDLCAVSIICSESWKADGLSTACFVMGYEKAKELLEGMDNTDAIFILTDGTITATEGLEYDLVDQS